MSMALKSQDIVTTLEFSETYHDFGVFKEEAGRKTFDFIITNTGAHPLKIYNVTASCGCTTPEWTKQSIAPGGKGKVTAIYDPMNIPGVFKKTLTVYTNTTPASTTLIIKGEVTPREKTIEELCTYPMGSVRFQSNRLEFNYVKKTEKKEMGMEIFNPSPSAVKVEFEGLPSYLKLKVEPEILPPGKKGHIIGTFDATEIPQWGYVGNRVRIKLNGVLQENVSYILAANLIEDFSNLSVEDLANAPIFKLYSNTSYLGKIKESSQNDVEFKFTNEGKSDLIIRHINTTCGCTTVQQGNVGVGIKPGEASSIKAVFNSSGYKGKVTKTIYVYTNDPKNSEVVLMFNADVIQAEEMK